MMHEASSNQQRKIIFFFLREKKGGRWSYDMIKPTLFSDVARLHP